MQTVVSKRTEYSNTRKSKSKMLRELLDSPADPVCMAAGRSPEI